MPSKSKLFAELLDGSGDIKSEHLDNTITNLGNAFIPSSEANNFLLKSNNLNDLQNIDSAKSILGAGYSSVNKSGSRIKVDESFSRNIIELSNQNTRIDLTEFDQEKEITIELKNNYLGSEVAELEDISLVEKNYFDPTGTTETIEHFQLSTDGSKLFYSLSSTDAKIYCANLGEPFNFDTVTDTIEYVCPGTSSGNPKAPFSFDFTSDGVGLLFYSNNQTDALQGMATTVKLGTAWDLSTFPDPFIVHEGQTGVVADGFPKQVPVNNNYVGFSRNGIQYNYSTKLFWSNATNIINDIHRNGLYYTGYTHTGGQSYFTWEAVTMPPNHFNWTAWYKQPTSTYKIGSTTANFTLGHEYQSFLELAYLSKVKSYDSSSFSLIGVSHSNQWKYIRLKKDSGTISVENIFSKDGIGLIADHSVIKDDLAMSGSGYEYEVTSKIAGGFHDKGGRLIFYNKITKEFETRFFSKPTVSFFEDVDKSAVDDLSVIPRYGETSQFKVYGRDKSFKLLPVEDESYEISSLRKEVDSIKSMLSTRAITIDDSLGANSPNLSSDLSCEIGSRLELVNNSSRVDTSETITEVEYVQESFIMQRTDGGYGSYPAFNLEDYPTGMFMLIQDIQPSDLSEKLKVKYFIVNGEVVKSDFFSTFAYHQYRTNQGYSDLHITTEEITSGDYIYTVNRTTNPFVSNLRNLIYSEGAHYTQNVYDGYQDSQMIIFSVPGTRRKINNPRTYDLYFKFDNRNVIRSNIEDTQSIDGKLSILISKDLIDRRNVIKNRFNGSGVINQIFLSDRNENFSDIPILLSGSENITRTKKITTDSSVSSQTDLYANQYPVYHVDIDILETAFDFNLQDIGSTGTSASLILFVTHGDNILINFNASGQSIDWGIAGEPVITGTRTNVFSFMKINGTEIWMASHIFSSENVQQFGY